MLAVVWPVLHRYELAPLAVNVAEPPGQMVDTEALIATTGFAFTVMFILATSEQPLALVPVTV